MMRRNRAIGMMLGLLGGFLSGLVTFYLLKKNNNNETKVSISKEKKFKQYYQLINQWLILKNNNKSIVNYLISQGYQSVAIYGMGELGNRLYEELVNSDIEVKYAIDQLPESSFSELKFIELSEDIEPVDAIIVTPVFDFEEIEKNISEIVDYPVISLEDVVFEM
jgi:hypothetical protein